MQPTATPLPTPTLAPTATATPRLGVGLVPVTPTPIPTPTPVPDLVALSKDLPPQVLVGTVLIDGTPAPDGTVIKALIDGQEIASTEVEDGRYLPLFIGIPDITITFLVGDRAAAETFVTRVGGVEVLNLTADNAAGAY